MKHIEMTEATARDLFYLISHELRTNNELHGSVIQRLRDLQYQLQQAVWGDQCGPWGCGGEHATDQCRTEKSLNPGINHWEPQCPSCGHAIHHETCALEVSSGATGTVLDLIDMKKCGCERKA